jgi:hypothetical protein
MVIAAPIVTAMTGQTVEKMAQAKGEVEGALSLGLVHVSRQQG